MLDTVLHTLCTLIHLILVHLPDSGPYEVGAVIIAVSLEEEIEAQRR